MVGWVRLPSRNPRGVVRWRSRVGEQVTHPTKLPLVTVIPALSLPQVTVTHAPSLPPVIVIPAQAGIHVLVYKRLWIPACAGMTGVRL